MAKNNDNWAQSACKCFRSRWLQHCGEHDKRMEYQRSTSRFLPCTVWEERPTFTLVQLLKGPHVQIIPSWLSNFDFYQKVIVCVFKHGWLPVTYIRVLLLKVLVNCGDLTCTLESWCFYPNACSRALCSACHRGAITPVLCHQSSDKAKTSDPSDNKDPSKRPHPTNATRGRQAI
jgi:hypothetical protein